MLTIDEADTLKAEIEALIQEDTRAGRGISPISGYTIENILELIDNYTEED